MLQALALTFALCHFTAGYNLVELNGPKNPTPGFINFLLEAYCTHWMLNKHLKINVTSSYAEMEKIGDAAFSSDWIKVFFTL